MASLTVSMLNCDTKTVVRSFNFDDVTIYSTTVNYTVIPAPHFHTQYRSQVHEGRYHGDQRPSQAERCAPRKTDVGISAKEATTATWPL